jgi:hypothetical protein
MSVTKVTGMMQTSTVGGDIPSASTFVVDTDGDHFSVTGTTGITSMQVAAGRRFTLQFDGALTLTHGSSLYLPGATNFTTEANDCLSFIATAANTVRCIGYALKDGGSPVVAAGGSWNLIATAVASNSASLTITGLDSTYDTYAVAFSDLVPASDSQTPQLRVGDSGGLDTGSSDYSHLRMGDRVDNASFNLTGSMHNAVDRMNLMSNGAGNAAGEGFGGMMFVHNPQDSTSRHTFTGQFTCMNYAGAFCYDTFGGQRNTVINLDRINFQFQAGNITSGRMTVWGIAHA